MIMRAHPPDTIFSLDKIGLSAWTFQYSITGMINPIYKVNIKSFTIGFVVHPANAIASPIEGMNKANK